MISSPSSSSAWTHDVFLSFRGGDTRKTFTGHLYAALTGAGVRAFIDDAGLPRGENIPTELARAIMGSRIAIVVFSRRYAESKWCLQELAKIMECRRTVRQTVLPVFYDVDPSLVRHQTGVYAEAFVKHGERFGLDSDKVLRWREALSEAADLSGWDLQNTAHGHESKFIKKIVEEVSGQLKNAYLFVALYPVGIESRLHVMSLLLRITTDDKVRMVGIWGMGGMGKTTLAKAVYNQLYNDFEGRSFLANVREIWSQPNHRVSLQEQLLFDILKRKVKLDNVDRGIVEIKERVCRMKVLVVVDDVDHVDQLNAVARSHAWFGAGSRIIITTRDRHLLDELKVDPIHEAKKMSETESLELFCWHAFRKSCPSQGFAQLSSDVATYCAGLPLALEVLGSFLFGRSVKEWESVLAKLKRIPNEKIQEKLRISYDALSDELIKDIFLDIACFFIGMDRNYVLEILDGCGLFAEIGINVLLQRCLVTVSEENKLMMHGLLRDMGRHIVWENSRKKLGERSRLWFHEDVVDVLTKEMGTDQIEGLSINMDRPSKVCFSTKALAKMQRLRLLRLDYVQLKGSYQNLSRELRWLCWRGFPLKFIPNDFYLGKLIAIDLRYSNLRQVWKEPQLLEKLQVLNLSHSHHLTHTPDFSKLPNLKKLILKDCRSLHEVHPSIGCLNSLVLANFQDCKVLQKLPKGFYQLKSLETLVLSGCSMFDHLDDDIGRLTSMKTFIANDTGIRKVPFTIVRLMNLNYLSLCGLKASPSRPFASLIWAWLMRKKTTLPTLLLPSSLQGLSSLTTLSLVNCNLKDDAIPKDFGTSLPALVNLKLQNNSFCSLPPTFGNLPNLKSLWLDNCKMLSSIPNLPPSLMAFYATNCTALENMPDISRSKLQTLSLTNCDKLVVVPGLDNLSKSAIVHNMDGSTSVFTAFNESLLQECSKTEGSLVLHGDNFAESFSHKGDGASMCFEVPKAADCNLMGFALRTVYSPSSSDAVSLNLPSILVVNHTTERKTSIRSITGDNVTSREENIWQGFFSNEMFKLEGGDKVSVTVDFGAQFTVKTTALHLLWDKYVVGQKANENGMLGSDDNSLGKVEEWVYV